MDKQTQISFYRKQMQTSQELKEVAIQNLHIATRLESEAKSALDLLGDKPKRARKGNPLSIELKTKLKASLTK